MLDTITHIGVADSVCVYAEGSYGIVYISSSLDITCATCRFGKTSCKHIKHLSSVITDEQMQPELPDSLQTFSSVLKQSVNLTRLNLVTAKHGNPRYTIPCISTKQIPFTIPSHLSVVLTLQSLSERFNISDNVASLIPEDTSSPCQHCAQASWDSPICDLNSVIVTGNQLIRAKGQLYIFV